MPIERWQPFTELMSLRQAMDKLFEDSFVRPSRALAAFAEVTVPALDVYQTPNEVVVKAALPGVKTEDVSIDISGETLTTKGGDQIGRGGQERGLPISRETLWRFLPRCGPSRRA